MLVSATELASGTRAECCIVGAGPAGLVVAAELAAAGRDVLVVESGGTDPDPAAQSLNQGIALGPPYAGLAGTRHRQVGGTARLWNTPVAGETGARYVPLQPQDFADWPFPSATLDPWYERAQVLCGLGPFCYSALPWSSEDRPCPEPDRGPWRCGVYQFGSFRVLIEQLIGRLVALETVRLCHGATVTGLTATRGGTGIRGVTAIRRDGSRLEITAPVVVLAAGAVENARLLLYHRGAFPSMDAGDWLGRCFMEHPRDFSPTLALRDPDDLRWFRFFDQHRARDGTIIAGRLELQDDAARDYQVPSAAVTLLPVPRASRTLLQRVLRRRPGPGPGSYGWSNQDRPCDLCRLVVNLEQAPLREHRILLDQTTDSTGLPRPRLEWTWSDPAQAGLDRLRRLLAGWLEDAGRGKVWFREGAPPDLNGHHHAGTTRMAGDPRGGVVTPDLAVHGVDNLFLAGPSVFPRAGWANPMLTIVALSLRLADHLSRRA